MTQPTRRDLETFANVAANFPRLLEWLSEERDQAVKQLSLQRDVIIIHRLQGDISRLDKLIDYMTNASKLLRPPESRTTL